MNPRVNKWLDLLDRAGWTAIQAAAGAALVYVTDTAALDWEAFFVFVGGATALAVLKVVVGQNTGQDDTGALLPTDKPIIEPPPDAA